MSVSSPSFIVFPHRSKLLVCTAPVKGINPAGSPEAPTSHTEMLALMTVRDELEPEALQIGTVHVMVRVEFGDTAAELMAFRKKVS